ncbi:hypothetical protein BW247_12270 [Acidihalobacter ferrooxydans]|uniref:L-asparaginase n=2 Tax=Acidihalobacter ferrooxydans TaxID=1765967 RepID=A0A1P8ULI4_9GAMM|nr:asparaginase [Acidihalobacter ferrooxydans]APZ44700.1 hypothetical protein BW247_12270 [Acidihalobacter ferrooxydans]
MAKKIAVISTGGTIASQYDPETASMVATMSATDLIETASIKDADFELVASEYGRINSYNLRFDTLIKIANDLNSILADADLLGAVIMQGTDTLEEAAYFLDLIVDSEKPIVMIGAQLTPEHPQCDGPRNLSDALRTVSADEMRGCGVMVGFNGQLHASREVVKMHTSALETFSSLNYGHLGVVDEGTVIRYRTPVERPHYALSAMADSKVALVKCVMDADGFLVDAAVDAGVDGLVIEAFGRGNVVDTFVPGICRAIERNIPVVIASRSLMGRVKPIYGASGGGKMLEDIGVVFAGDLSAQKARVLLMVLLAMGFDGRQLAAELQRNAC